MSQLEGDYGPIGGAGGSGTGDVVGPGASTDNAIARWNGTTGVDIQNSAAFVDDNGNVYAPNLANGYATTATAAGTTTLTVASKGIQVFTGATTQTVTLPVVSTLPQTGFGYWIINDSSGAVTVNSSGGNAVQVMAAGSRMLVVANALSGTGASVWDKMYVLAASGDVTASGTLTSNAVMLGGGTTVVKAVAGIITDGVSKLTLGEAGTSVGSIDLKNATSGTLNIAPQTGALGTSNLVAPAVSGTITVNDAAQTLTNKTINCSSNTVTNLSLATGVTGNLPVTNLNSGTNATSSTFWRGDGTWVAPSGSGDVTKVGTPANNQVAVWTGDGTVEGDTALTFDTSTNTLAVDGPITATSVTVSSGGEAGVVAMAEGTAPSLTANQVKHYASTDVPAGGTAYVWGSEAAATGFMLATNTAGVMPVTHIGSSGTGNVVRVTSATLVTPTLGAATATSINGNTFTTGTYTLTGTAGKTLNFTNSIVLAGTDGTTMTFPPASASIGYLNIPQNSQSTAYTTVLADAGKHILHPTADNNARTFTIDSNANVAYPVGTTLTFINQINTVTIAITSDTLTLAGAGTTGSRTLAANGIATAVKIATTSWIISGTGLT